METSKLLNGGHNANKLGEEEKTVEKTHEKNVIKKSQVAQEKVDYEEKPADNGITKSESEITKSESENLCNSTENEEIKSSEIKSSLDTANADKEIKIDDGKEVNLDDLDVKIKTYVQPEANECEQNPDFAVVCSFWLRYSKLLNLPVFGIKRLTDMFLNPKQYEERLIELHVYLMRRFAKTKNINRNRWEKFLVKYCNEYVSEREAFEVDQSGYRKCNVATRIKIFKHLLEGQFDHNARFKGEINKNSGGELRGLPLGCDVNGLQYWYQVDDDMNVRVYRDDTDDNGSWQLLVKNRETLLGLIDSLKKSPDYLVPKSGYSSSTGSECGDVPAVDSKSVRDEILSITKFAANEVEGDGRKTFSRSRSEFVGKMSPLAKEHKVKVEVEEDVSKVENSARKVEKDGTKVKKDGGKLVVEDDDDDENNRETDDDKVEKKGGDKVEKKDEDKVEKKDRDKVEKKDGDKVKKKDGDKVEGKGGVEVKEESKDTIEQENIETKIVKSKKQRDDGENSDEPMSRNSGTKRNEDGDLNEKRGETMSEIKETTSPRKRKMKKSEADRLAEAAAGIGRVSRSTRQCVIKAKEEKRMKQKQEEQDRKLQGEERERRKLERIEMRKMRLEEYEDYRKEKVKRKKDKKLEKEDQKKSKKKGRRRESEEDERDTDSSEEFLRQLHEKEEEEEEADFIFNTSDHEFSGEELDEDGEIYVPILAKTALRKLMRRGMKNQSDEDDDDESEVEIDEKPCKRCNCNDHPEYILLCDTCDDGYHTSCLHPPLLVIPEGDWHCPMCQHTSLCKKLEDELTRLDELKKKMDLSHLRQQRLDYVNVSLANVITKAGRKKHRIESDGDGSDDHDSSDETRGRRSDSPGATSDDYSSDISSSTKVSDEEEEDETFVRRSRRATATTTKDYKFSSFDNTIFNAIKDELEANKDRQQGPSPGKSRGKDMSTIMEYEQQEEKDTGEETEEKPTKEEIDMVKEDGDKSEDEKEDEVVEKEEELNDDEPPPPLREVQRKRKQQKKKVNDLGWTDEEDGGDDSDEYKVTSEEESDPSYQESEESWDEEEEKYRRTRRSSRTRKRRRRRGGSDDDSDEEWGGEKRRSRGKKKTRRGSNRYEDDDNFVVGDSDVEEDQSRKRKRSRGGESKLPARRAAMKKRISYRDNESSDDDDELKHTGEKKEKWSRLNFTSSASKRRRIVAPSDSDEEKDDKIDDEDKDDDDDNDDDDKKKDKIDDDDDDEKDKLDIAEDSSESEV